MSTLIKFPDMMGGAPEKGDRGAETPPSRKRLFSRKRIVSPEEEEVVKCGVCGAIMPITATQCARCGSVFKTDFEEVVYFILFVISLLVTITIVIYPVLEGGRFARLPLESTVVRAGIGATIITLILYILKRAGISLYAGYRYLSAAIKAREAIVIEIEKKVAFLIFMVGVALLMYTLVHDALEGRPIDYSDSWDQMMIIISMFICVAGLAWLLVARAKTPEKKEVEAAKGPPEPTPMYIMGGQLDVRNIPLENPGEREEKLTKIAGETKSTRTQRVLYPFTAIVGQEAMKKALILNAINPRIGGVLARGQKGTAKSTAVRALTEVLPEIEVVAGCRFNCNPSDPEKLCWECKERYEKGTLRTKMRPIKVVDLPLNATEDRVVGSLDIEKVLTEGLRSFEPGILAEANQGILYVDEINLLDDYVVDVLLDAAAMGICTVERESVSVSHPAEFIIVGTMNPEEGELRPQLLDRIALQAEIKGLKDSEQRTEIIKRIHEFNANPHKFRAKYEEEQRKLRARIVKARQLLPRVTTPSKILDIIAKICIDFNVDGHRADIIIERTARTNAAYEGRTQVTVDDVIEAAELVLPHRMRRRPFEEGEFSSDLLRTLVTREET
jgi:magnesium chelatase subunit I